MHSTIVLCTTPGKVLLSTETYVKLLCIIMHIILERAWGDGRIRELAVKLKVGHKKEHIWGDGLHLQETQKKISPPLTTSSSNILLYYNALWFHEVVIRKFSQQTFCYLSAPFKSLVLPPSLIDLCLKRTYICIPHHLQIIIIKEGGGNETKAKENNKYLLIPQQIYMLQFYLPLFSIIPSGIHTAIAGCILPVKSTFLSQISTWTYICLSHMLLLPARWFVTSNLCMSSK